VPKEVRQLIRTMSCENPLWGAPRIHGELLKLGIDIGETSVSKYLVRRHKPPPRPGGPSSTTTWRPWFPLTSLRCRRSGSRSSTCSWCWRTTGGAFCIFGVTAHPNAEWTAQQLREAFPWETAPRYLLRDHDRVLGVEFVTQVKAMGIKQVLSTPRSPWQRAYVERLIGTIRRECLDHVIVFSEAGLSRHLRNFADYYHGSRTHLGLQKDTPEPRPVQGPEAGRIVAIPKLGDLHHRYERRAA
jgi:putative transposase